MRHRPRKQKRRWRAAFGLALLMPSACSLLVNTSVPSDDGGQSSGGSSGSASYSGGRGATGGVGGIGGEAGGIAGGAGDAGDNGRGGEAGASGASAGGSSGGGRCLGQPNEFSTKGWFVNTGDDGASAKIEPAPNRPGSFADGECVCVSGSRVNQTGYASLVFENAGGVEFSSLDLKLVSASPDLALPTLYVHRADGTKYCRVFNDEQVGAVNRGEAMTTISSQALHGFSDCNNSPERMAPGQLITHVQFQVDTYERGGRLDFDFCVVKLAINP